MYHIKIPLIQYQPVPPHTDPVKPSTNQYCLLLTQYHHISFSNVRLSFVDLRWAQLYVSLVSLLLFLLTLPGKAKGSPLFKLFGGPLSLHHANDVQRLWWTYSSREDLYTPSFGNLQDKLKVRAAEKSHTGLWRQNAVLRAVETPYPKVNPIQYQPKKSLFRRKRSNPYLSNLYIPESVFCCFGTFDWNQHYGKCLLNDCSKTELMCLFRTGYVISHKHFGGVYETNWENWRRPQNRCDSGKWRCHPVSKTKTLKLKTNKVYLSALHVI